MAGGGKGGEYMNLGWDKDCDVGLGFNMQRKKMMSDEQISPFGDGLKSAIPFTPDQRQELERQTIIYKYMMASMPIPPQLLIPLSKKSGVTTSTSGGVGRGADLEPWRCRRTDGKKWRCTRDVTPDQKYCERHSHKPRPSARSRKPVETRISPTPPTARNCGGSNSIDFASPLVQYNMIPHHSYRYPEQLLKKDVFTSSPFRHENRNVGQRPDTATATATTGTTTAFIDAWSLADASNPTSVGTPTMTSASSPGNSMLPLTLSVSSGTGVDDLHSHEDDEAVGMRLSSQPFNWMTSWMSSPPGGPLAEALCLGISGAGNYDMRNNFEDLVSSNSGVKDDSDQFFRLH